MSADNFSKSTKIKFAAIVVVLMIGVIFLLKRQEERRRNKIKANYNTTLGWITGYKEHKVKRRTHKSLVYTFKVGSLTYDTETEFTSLNYEVCAQKPNEECRKLRFWVIYSKDNPRESLINLCCDVHTNPDATFPTTLLDGFQ